MSGANRKLVYVTAAGVALSLCGFLVAERINIRSQGDELDRLANHYARAVQNAMDDYVAATMEIAQPFARKSADVSRWDFYDVVQLRVARYPGLRALIWAPRVEARNVRRYEEKAQKDGLFGFQLREPSDDGRSVPVTQRPQYFPAYFVEPFFGNEKILGHDLGAGNKLRAAMALAADRNRVVAIEPGDWGVLEINETLMVLVQPVFPSIRDEAAQAPQRNSLKGYVVGIIDIAEIFRETIRQYAAPAPVDAFLYTTPASNEKPAMIAVHGSTLLFGRDPPAAPGPDALTADARAIELAGRRFSLVVAAAPDPVYSPGTVISIGVALIGFLLTALLVQTLKARQVRIQRGAGGSSSDGDQLRKAQALNKALQSEIRQRTAIEDELRAAKTQAEIANRAKTDFLAIISHELRTPLNAIIGFSEVLSDEMFGPLGEERYRGYASDINESAQHLLNLINSILNLTRVEGDHYELSETNVDLVRVIHDSVRLIEGKAREGNLKVITAPENGLPLVFGDQLALRQIMINLLQNAVKFTPAGGRVTVKVWRDEEGRILVEVADTGVGITRENMQRVFEPFVQADTSLSRSFEGVGLGLALCRKLAEMHEGTIELDSEHGNGTTVRLILPAERAINVYRAALA